MSIYMWREATQTPITVTATYTGTSYSSSGNGCYLSFTAEEDMFISKIIFYGLPSVMISGTVTDETTGDVIYTLSPMGASGDTTIDTNINIVSGHNYSLSVSGWSGGMGSHSFNSYTASSGNVSDIISNVSGWIRVQGIRSIALTFNV